MSGDTHDLAVENTELRERLEEAESVLQAIRLGEIDAVIVAGADGVDAERVFTLEGADHPYRVLVESMSEGAATLSRDGVILYANPRLAGLLSVPRTDLTGTSILDWAAAPDIALLEKMVQSCGSEAVAAEVSFVTKDGAELPVNASFSSLYLDKERFCCAIITDQSLAKHHAELKQANLRIQEANKRLSEADRRKDEFLATLAHELRNPLAPIRTAAHVIKALDYDDEKLEHARAMIDRQVTHMTRLVDDLLELSRITLGRLRLQRQAEDLITVLEGVIDGTTITAGAPQKLTVELPRERLPVHGDAVRLSQAIANVIENAIKYTPAEGRIEVSAYREADDAIIRIRDNGVGISAGALPRIFEMFEQEDREQGQRQNGLGIGLALTRSIVELHGGTICASSEGPGAGSEFVIRLPLNDTEPVTTHDDERPESSVQRQVLIVDDNVDAAESLRMVLELSGHIAKSVYAGTAALEALQECRPDLVLLDIGLPDMDGYEVARQLRARHGDSCPRLVALSGWGRAEDKQRAAAAGIDGYLTKPVNPSILNRLISEILPVR